jgi:hypothetical protein
MKGLYIFLTGIIGYETLKEVVSRVLSIGGYPLAYILRHKIRDHLYCIDKELVVERSFEDTKNVPLGSFYSKVNWFYFGLWMFLDDSPARDNYNEDGSRRYDSSNTRRYYPSDFVYNTRWLRDFWWSFIRNNTVNYVSWTKTTGWQEPLVYEELWGKFDLAIDKKDDNSYYVPGMYLINVLHKDGKYHPRFTWVGEVFGYKCAAWMGLSKGSGRFSFSMRVKK